jgi:hypothetical protein
LAKRKSHGLRCCRRYHVDFDTRAFSHSVDVFFFGSSRPRSSAPSPMDRPQALSWDGVTSPQISRRRIAISRCRVRAVFSPYAVMICMRNCSPSKSRPVRRVCSSFTSFETERSGRPIQIRNLCRKLYSFHYLCGACPFWPSCLVEVPGEPGAYQCCGEVAVPERRHQGASPSLALGHVPGTNHTAGNANTFAARPSTRARTCSAHRTNAAATARS